MELVEVVGSGIDITKLPDALLAAGIHAFSAQDAAEVAGIKPSSAWPALARLTKNRLAFSPARGLYVPIPPEYRSWGAVPATWFVDALMSHLGRAYYVGYLSAAEIYEAAHQRPQVFQVVVDRDVRDRSFGRVRLRFITNRDVAALPSIRRNTPTGTMAISTPALTALDLANRPENGGALHNVATVLIDLATDGKLDDWHWRSSCPSSRWPPAGDSAGSSSTSPMWTWTNWPRRSSSPATNRRNSTSIGRGGEGSILVGASVSTRRSSRPVIPAGFIRYWSRIALWPSPDQVEQDLVLSRLLCEIAAHPFLGSELVFRGGTCLHKVHLPHGAPLQRGSRLRAGDARADRSAVRLPP